MFKRCHVHIQPFFLQLTTATLQSGSLSWWKKSPARLYLSNPSYHVWVERGNFSLAVAWSFTIYLTDEILAISRRIPIVLHTPPLMPGHIAGCRYFWIWYDDLGKYRPPSVTQIISTYAVYSLPIPSAAVPYVFVLILLAIESYAQVYICTCKLFGWAHI
jgi:hypothetical protein